MTENKPLYIIIDNRELKLMALLDKKNDIITYESKQLDIADYYLALKNYIINLIILIKEIYVPVNENNQIGGKLLKKKLNLPFSISRINEMIRDLNEGLTSK